MGFSEKKSRLERMYIANALCDGRDSRDLKGKEVVTQGRDNFYVCEVSNECWGSLRPRKGDHSLSPRNRPLGIS